VLQKRDQCQTGFAVGKGEAAKGGYLIRSGARSIGQRPIVQNPFKPDSNFHPPSIIQHGLRRKIDSLQIDAAELADLAARDIRRLIVKLVFELKIRTQHVSAIDDRILLVRTAAEVIELIAQVRVVHGGQRV